MYCFRENSNFPFSNQKIITFTRSVQLVGVPFGYRLYHQWKIKLDSFTITSRSTNIKQVQSLGSFIKQSLELRTGGTWFHLFYCVLNLFICCTLYVSVLLTIQCNHWPWLGWKLCLIIKLIWLGWKLCLIIKLILFVSLMLCNLLR